MRNSFPALWVALAFAAASTVGSGLTGCSPAASSPSKQIVQPRSTSSGFVAVDSHGWADVEITLVEPSASEAESIHVTCADDLLPKVHTRVDADVLVVETDDTSGIFRWGTQSYRDEASCVVHVRMQKLGRVSTSGSGDIAVKGASADGLDRVTVHGSGTVHVSSPLKTTGTLSLSSTGSGKVLVDSLEAADVQVEIRGSGEMRVVGVARSVRARVSGSGDLDAQRLRTEEGTVHVSGSGDCKLFASRKVDIEANGSGDVFVTGHPSQKASKVTGSGNVRWE